MLTEHSEELETLAKALLEYETLTGEEITKVVAGEALGAIEDDPAPVPSVSAIPRTKPAAKPDDKGEPSA